MKTSAFASAHAAAAAALFMGFVMQPAHAQAPPAAAPAITATAITTTPSDLYIAFGGRAGIAALMDDFVVRLKADPRTAPFFDKTNLPEFSRGLTDQLCMLSGGPCKYTGASMKKAHDDLDIRRRDFNALVEVLQDSMGAKGIPFSTQNRMLALLAPMHRDVVTKP